MPAESLRQWHRLFGIALTDLFTDSPWRVELEKELALKSQLLDVVLIEQVEGQARSAEAAALALPDGLEGLRAHNLLTYKSLHEALDAWAVEELIGHYVNYRKLTGTTADPSHGETQTGTGGLLPEEDFQLYAVATRYPDKLARAVSFEDTEWAGVFDLRWGARTIRLIVLSRIAQHARNAPWELFSTRMERVRHGAEHYRTRSPGAEVLLHELYLRFKLELPEMAYTMDDFLREHRQHVLDEIDEFSPEERQAFLKRLSAEERLRGIPAEERLRGIPAEERLRGLPAEERLRGLPPEERLNGLSPEELQQLRDALNKKLN